MDNIWTHYVPDDDLIEHTADENGYAEFICRCNPKVNYDTKEIMHEAMDRRVVFIDDDDWK